MQRLLVATQSDDPETERICTLLGLSQALVSSEALDQTSMELLTRALKPFIRTDQHEARVQKRGYKVMLEICHRYSHFVTDTSRLNEMTELLTSSIMTCQISARHMRLKCIFMMVSKGFDSSNKAHRAVIPKITGEVLLCLKDSNAKTREAAYQLLLAMAGAMDGVKSFLNVLVAALAGETPHMRSAAVMGMSRLVFELSRTNEELQDVLPSLLQTVLVLFREDSREVLKSAVGFVRVAVAALPPNDLEPLLPELLQSLLGNNKGKDRFRSKIKIILKKLVRLYGHDKLMPLVPETDTRLLNHMRKLSERAARRKAEQREANDNGNGDDDDDGQYSRHSKAGFGFDEMMDSDEDDSDDGRTLMTGVTGFTRLTGRTGKSIRTEAMERSERKSLKSRASAVTDMSRRSMSGAQVRLRSDADGEVVDMLDPSMAKSVRFADEGDNDYDDDYDGRAGDDDDDDSAALEFDDLGRLVIQEEDETQDKGGTGGSKAGPTIPKQIGGDRNDKSNDESGSSKKRKLSKFESAKMARDEASKKRGQQQQQQQKTRHLGAAFKSKKAGGDVKKKTQKFEPYAYVPLDGKQYSKKNRRKAVQEMSTVVRSSGKRKR